MLNWIPVTKNTFLQPGTFIRYTPVDTRILPDYNWERITHPEQVGIVGDFETQWCEYHNNMKCFEAYKVEELEQGYFYEVTHYLECPVLQDMTEEQLEKIVELLSGI